MFNSTKIYSVYEKLGSGDSLENSVIVKEGFSWPAFFFPFLWAVFGRIWWAAALFLLFNIGLLLAAQHKIIAEEMSIVIQFAIMLVAGFSANDWHGERLLKNDYELRDIIFARSETGAKYKFFQKQLRTSEPIMI